jgi:small subunit ribosomal protein S20
MPIIKSAVKKMRQDVKRDARNKSVKTNMKTSIKNVFETLQKDVEGAEKLLSKAYSAIDVALKKNLIKKNNAARKKSRLARAIANMRSKVTGAVKDVQKVTKEVKE